MGLYVEVMCDVRREGSDPKDMLSAFCWSDNNNNPQGPTVKDAKAEAKARGWLVGPRRKAVCPNCRKLDPPPPSSV